MNTDTGSRLTALRTARGLSQEQLAAQMCVSRQAVSNWERSASLPDTANLLRLSELYGVTLDDLLGRTSSDSREGGLSDHAVPGGGVLVPRLRRALPLACVALSTAYYLLVAQPLLLSTVHDLSDVFGLAIGPSLAMLWIAAEFVFVALPFALMAAVPVAFPRRIWIAPLAVFSAIMLANIGSSAMGGALIDFSGIGGALMPSVAIKTDLLALGVGCVLLDVVRRPGGATVRQTITAT